MRVWLAGHERGHDLPITRTAHTGRLSPALGPESTVFNCSLENLSRFLTAWLRPEVSLRSERYPSPCYAFLAPVFFFGGPLLP